MNLSPARSAAIAALLVAGTLGASEARAQYFGAPFPLFNGVYVNERVPFYALHPPVYYKYPVPRHYGYSPYAYPPGVITPDVTTVSPLLVINPYVATVPEPPAISAADSSAQPTVIKNPFAP